MCTGIFTHYKLLLAAVDSFVFLPIVLASILSLPLTKSVRVRHKSSAVIGIEEQSLPTMLNKMSLFNESTKNGLPSRLLFCFLFVCLFVLGGGVFIKSDIESNFSLLNKVIPPSYPTMWLC